MKRILTLICAAAFLLIAGCSVSGNAAAQPPAKSTEVSETADGVLPYLVMYSGRLYIFDCEYVPRDEFDALEKAGELLGSGDSPNEMPKEDFYTNCRTCVGYSLWTQDGKLLMDSDREGYLWPLTAYEELFPSR